MAISEFQKLSEDPCTPERQLCFLVIIPSLASASFDAFSNGSLSSGAFDLFDGSCEGGFSLRSRPCWGQDGVELRVGSVVEQVVVEFDETFLAGDLDSEGIGLAAIEHATAVGRVFVDGAAARVVEEDTGAVLALFGDDGG